MTVFQIGTEVFIGGDIPATVKAISIRGDVQYEVVWWDGRTRKCEWLDEFEVSSKHRPTVQIGFKTADE